MFKKFQQVGRQAFLEKEITALFSPEHIETIDAAQKFVVLKNISQAQLSEAQQKLPDVKIIATEHKAPAPAQKEIQLPKIKRIIAVGSGKGGVGKSTIALALAKALQKQGQKVGLLDLDIYGPSLPTQLNLTGVKAEEQQKQFQPLNVDGLTVMSLGFLIDHQKATIWRGPMVMGAVQQLLKDTNWPQLDTLVLDLPPGTGDAQLTLAQKVRLDGAVIITTPHDLSVIDAQKSLQMFQKMQVPILGVIENMAYFSCSDCSKKHYVFGEGKIKDLCQEWGVPLLLQIPISQNNDITDIMDNIHI